MPDYNKTRAFTLIELLIVVAIIAILAAIAVPNFLEAQVRAKVARVRTEMRSLAVALEAYRTDQPAYPPYFLSPSIRVQPTSARLRPLTTPVAYVSSVWKDVFALHSLDRNYDAFDYVDEESGKRFFTPPYDYQWTYGYAWIMNSMGPDIINQFRSIGYPDMFYDPTNGTVSTGDIVRAGPRGQYFQEYYAPIQ
jgi:prepilin-type N-terminal cleavage/methylation domain-containing protein